MNKKVYPQISGIYKITSPSGKVYIGQSIDLWQRQRSYRKNLDKQQRALYNSVAKYGWKAHTFEVIKMCPIEELTKFEQYYMDEYKSYDRRFGLNIRMAGFKGKVSEETKVLISKANKGKPGKKGSDNPLSKRILQFNKSGELLKRWESINSIQYELGLNRVNIRKCCLNKTGSAYGFVWKYEDKDLGKFIYREGGHPKRPILQFTLDGKFVREWEYINKIGKDLGLNTPNICKACNGKQMTAYGFIWKYKNEKRA